MASSPERSQAWRTTFTGASIAVLIAVGATVGVVTAFLLARVSQREFMRLMETQRPAFPSEASGPESS